MKKLCVLSLILVFSSSFSFSMDKVENDADAAHLRELKEFINAKSDVERKVDFIRKREDENNIVYVG